MHFPKDKWSVEPVFGLLRLLRNEAHMSGLLAAAGGLRRGRLGRDVAERRLLSREESDLALLLLQKRGCLCLVGG